MFTPLDYLMILARRGAAPDANAEERAAWLLCNAVFDHFPVLDSQARDGIRQFTNLCGHGHDAAGSRLFGGVGYVIR